MFKNYFIAILLACGSPLFAQKNVQTQLTKISHSVSEKESVESLFDSSLYPFYHGVASGDPTTSSVIIWTRVSPTTDADITVTWKVTTDPQLQNVVKQGSLVTNVSKDYTVKLDVTGLQANKTYYYGFNALGKNSATGRTRTVPTNNVSQLRFAVVSCSNYQNGYFNVYDRIAERNDLDAVIHLGDYIYEYEKGGFGYSQEVGRGHEPANETITLQDYRVRHSFYKLDPALRKIHQQHPFILVWDDHEFANDAYVDGAENHQPETEGNWNNRKNNAWKAYFEWMPIRDNAQKPNRIYRKIQYGNLLDLIMLDTRIEGRDKPDGGKLFRENNQKNKFSSELEANKFLLRSFLEETFQMNNGVGLISKEEFESLYNTLLIYLEKAEWKSEKLSQVVSNEEMETLRNKVYENVQKAYAQMRSSDKKLLGDEQFNWLTQQLSNSQAKWKVLGNQVMMMPFIPLGLKDTWNGYEAERTRLYNHILQNNIKNVAVITGDIHMTFVGDLPESLLKYSSLFKKGSVGVEFVTPSVTSSNLDEFVGFSSSFLNWLVDLFNPHIKEANLSEHGYFILDVRNERIQADWFYVNDVKTITTGQRFSHGYYVNDGSRFLKKANGASSLISPNAPLQAPNAKNISTTETKQELNNLMILGNYPNPTQDITNLHFGVVKSSDISIHLYNEKGVMIHTLLESKLEGGLYNLEYNTKNLVDGIYFVRIHDNNQMISKKLIVKHQ